MMFEYQALRIPPHFLANHPFIILLLQKPNILFHGKVVLPISGDENIAPKGKPVKDPYSQNYSW